MRLYFAVMHSGSVILIVECRHFCEALPPNIFTVMMDSHAIDEENDYRAKR
jgi:hypothetical protein